MPCHAYHERLWVNQALSKNICTTSVEPSIDLFVTEHNLKAEIY